MESSQIAIVIPAFNEEKSIAAVVESIRDLATVIVVNDKSSDLTSVRASEAGAIVVELLHNKGYEGAIEEGFKQAVISGMDYVITMDADGQHTRISVEEMIKEIRRENTELILGYRQKSARIGEYLFCQYFKFRYKVKDPLCGMKAYDINIFKDAGFFDTQKLVGSELMLFALKKGVSFKQMPVEIKARLDDSRYGGSFRANKKIIQALGRVIKKDCLI